MLGDDRYVHGLDGGDGLTGAHVPLNSLRCTQ